MAAVIPLDIVYNILVHLSVKTLNKFRTVCRQWDILISLPLFQQDNNRHRQGNPLLLALRKIGEDIHLSTYSGSTVIDNFSKPVPELYLYPSFHSIQSCNGLVCIASKFGPVVICNPFTEELLTLPLTQGCTESNGCIGFGYAASVHEFKVVKFYCSPIDGWNCCRVFSLGTGVWREATRPRFYTPICCDHAPFLHGYLHILHYGHNTYSATAFDITREEYTVIPIPKFSHCSSIELKELGGSLCVVNNHDPVHLSLWLLKDYDSWEWVKEYDIILSRTLRSIEIIGIVHVNPLVILGDGTILLHVWKPGFDFANQLLCYNPEDKTITDTIDDYCSAVFYMESFQSLRSRSSRSITSTSSSHHSSGWG